NVARHAKATRVSIRLEQTPALLRLEVKDNGVGISTHCLSATDTKSLGVIGMRERAVACGGELDICPNSGGGTTVLLRVPLNGSASR
ncbi:MAG: histidine kinase, partial [Gemmatimonadetes bacterium]